MPRRSKRKSYSAWHEKSKRKEKTRATEEASNVTDDLIQTAAESIAGPSGINEANMQPTAGPNINLLPSVSAAGPSCQPMPKKRINRRDWLKGANLPQRTRYPSRRSVASSESSVADDTERMSVNSTSPTRLPFEVRVPELESFGAPPNEQIPDLDEIEDNPHESVAGPSGLGTTRQSEAIGPVEAAPGVDPILLPGPSGVTVVPVVEAVPGPSGVQRANKKKRNWRDMKPHSQTRYSTRSTAKPAENPEVDEIEEVAPPPMQVQSQPVAQESTVVEEQLPGPEVGVIVREEEPLIDVEEVEDLTELSQLPLEDVPMNTSQDIFAEEQPAEEPAQLVEDINVEDFLGSQESDWNVFDFPGSQEFVAAQPDDMPDRLVEDRPEVIVVPAGQIPVARRPILNEADVIQHECGAFNWECEYCGALYFRKELPQNLRLHLRRGYQLCCNGGRFRLPALEPLPDLLRRLYINRDHEESAHFMKYIRSYNSSLAFISVGANIESLDGRMHGSVFRLHGQVSHRISALHPPLNSNPCFGQLYIVESDMANDIRLQNHTFLDNALLRHLDATLREVNPYCAAYRMMHEAEAIENARADAEEREALHVYMVLREDGGVDRRRYNRPTARNEVAAIYISQDGMPPAERSLAVMPRVNAGEPFLRSILSTDVNIDPMSYPLLFPHGEPGWRINMPYDEEGGRRNRISMMQFYAYRLAVRAGVNRILSAGKLTQQFIIDCWVRVEGERLNWIRTNQGTLRAELYRGLMDHINNRAAREGLRVGRMVIVPSTFVGSARNMQQLYQDAMAIVREQGRPDLFITFTTNPTWPEIVHLLEGQMVADRPDLVARIFKLKFHAFLEDILKSHIFGNVKAYMYTIEFQKRGYPHAHCLFILSEPFKPRNSLIIDEMVTAEIPDPQSNPRLYQSVSKMLMHGPCGEQFPHASCMVNGRCSKKFPKPFSNFTLNDNSSYPIYRRRDDGRSVLKNNILLDNRWVVPYNQYLTLKYNAHINLEVCSGIQSIKYIYKYIYKGVDSARVAVVERDGEVEGDLDWDEVRSYIDARYVSAVEAVWRLREFKLHDRSHGVHRLPVHLEGQNMVVFREGNEQAAVDVGAVTELSDWFRLNTDDVRARQFLYQEIPHHYVFDTRNHRWAPRVRHTKLTVRMHHVSPCDVERFHLRILLFHVRGATSYEDLRTYGGVTYPTFVETARARNLVRDDAEWVRTLEEATTHEMPRRLRLMFASMCVYCELPDPLSLWQRFRDHLSEDYKRNHRTANLAYDFALRDIERTLRANGRSLATFGLPEVLNIPQHLDDANPDFDIQEERANAERDVPRLNVDQLEAFRRVTSSAYEGAPSNCFFLEGAAGTGKTFLYNTLLSHVRGRGDTAVACAYTGIAATLLKGGTTINYAFGFPLQVNEQATSNLTPRCEKAQTLLRAKVIILDEVTMLNKFHMNIIDSLLQFLTGNFRRPFGGKTILFGGDFRQTLPVLPRASRATITSSTIKSSRAYNHLHHLHLRTNMRAAAEEIDYAQFLLGVGNGTLRSNVETAAGDHLIEIPPQTAVEGLITAIYGERITSENANEYVESAILCPKNVDTAEMNEEILGKLETEERVYYSVDSCAPVNQVGEEDPLNVPVEFLHTLNPSGFPPHSLKLKLGCVVMLLRNLNVMRGLVNGTRLKILRLNPNHIEAEVLTGSAVGETVFLSRYELTELNPMLPFALKRRQFPLKVSYAMTINKSQGQTLTRVGLYLPQPVFSHGQLYVALSRARSLGNIRILIEDSERQGRLLQGDPRVFTPNVVWLEVLDNRP